MADSLARSQEQTQTALARLQSELATQQHEREALFDRRLEAAAVLATYREPLAAAAFDLQSRLYNILRMEFFRKWGESRPEDAIRSTVFRLAQYFGWTEILRRRIQFLSFPEDDDTRRVARLQSDIAHCFLTHSYGVALMIWSDEQRAIGERMIIEENGDLLCMGYARFSEQCNRAFHHECDRVRQEIQGDGVADRLRDVQHLLCDLVETLDSRRIRYTQNLERV